MTYLLTSESHSLGAGSWTYLFKKFLPYYHSFIDKVCVFLAPAFSSLTSIMTYLLTSELHSVGVGSWTY